MDREQLDRLKQKVWDKAANHRCRVCAGLGVNGSLAMRHHLVDVAVEEAVRLLDVDQPKPGN